MPEYPAGALEVPTPDPAPSPWQLIADSVKRNPLEWRRVTGHLADTVATTNISRGVLAAFRPAGEYEARRRGGDLYVRYLGTEAEQARAIGIVERGQA